MSQGIAFMTFLWRVQRVVYVVSGVVLLDGHRLRC
jgi:hypothetical protein